MRIRSSKPTLLALLLMALVAVALYAGAPASSAAPQGLVAELASATGGDVGTARFIPADDGGVLVRITASGLTPGFHGFHVHAVGVCDPAAKDLNGNAVPFFSAGGHYNPVTTNTHGSHAGDLPSLFVAEDGTALLRFKTDRFRNRELLDSDGSALIIHAAPDNLANVPATTATGGERYHSHVDNVFGPDTATKATGDAGARFACGVITKVAS